MNYQKFYSEVGKLLYAVANADGHIQKNEYDALKKTVRDILVPKEKHHDSYGTDSAYYAEIEFDYLDEAGYDPRAAFDSFVNFVELHRTAISDALRDRIYTAVEALAGSYRGITHSESALLLELIDEMNRIFKNQPV